MILEQCDGDNEALLDRLEAILLSATGLDGGRLSGSVNAISGDVYPPSVSVKFPKAVHAVERVNLWFEHDTVKLACWPAELKSQYTAVYSTPEKVGALVAAETLSTWRIYPNFQLAFPFSAAAMRWYPRRHLTGARNVTQWVDDLKDHRAGARNRSDVQGIAFWDWLIDRRYADADDRQGFEIWVGKQPARRQIHVRPGFEVRQEWSFGEAVARDGAGQLTSDVRACINDMLVALREPRLHTTSL